MANRFFPSYDNYKITDRYGERVIFGKKSFHHGVDLVAMDKNGNSRTDYIKAHMGGKVVLVGYNDDIGNYIYIETEPGVQMAYFHFRDKLKFKVGDKVSKGQVLGYMGKTGKVTGAHLHWAIKVDGAWINPEPYLDKDYEKVKTPIYQGYLDVATTTNISGWAWNGIDDEALLITITIQKDGKVVKTLTTYANLYRSDLENAKKGNGKHGFSVKFDFATLGVGTYKVSAHTNGKQLNNVKTVKVAATVQAKPTQIVGSANVKYFPKYVGKTTSISEALKSVGAQWSFSYRSKIAKANNIKLYVGSAKQNTSMLNLLKQGKLIKP